MNKTFVLYAGHIDLIDFQYWEANMLSNEHVKLIE